MKTKKLFLKLTGITLLILLLFACRQESILAEKQTNSNSISFLKLSDLKNEIKNKDINIIKKVGNNTNNSTAKINSFSNYFILDTLNIKKLDYNNKSTYTFRVYNSEQTPNNYYNLVLHNTNGKWIETLLKIKKDNSNKKTIEVIYDSRYGNVTTINPASACTMRTCVGTFDVYEFHCTCPPEWGECDGCSECISTHQETFIYDCSDNGDGGDGSSGNPPSGGSGGGSSSTPTNPYNDFTFSANDSLYMICAEGDTQCMSNVQNIIATSNFFNSLGLNGLTLSSYNNIFFMVKDYLANGNSEQVMAERINLVGSWMRLQDNSTEEKKLNNYEFAYWVLNFLTENSDIIAPENFLTRVYDLENALVQNQNKLLNIPCNQLPFWQDIAQHQIPQTVKNKLNNIPNQNSYWSSWNITDLDDGAGARVNMDLFPIKISTMPNKPNSTQKYTPEEFFDFFRKNINLFAEKFTPIEDSYHNIHDTALWNSSNPLGSLIHIDITPDDGTVICSGFSTNAWIFSTIKAPLGWSYDGIHPVSGNRVFSYYMDGSTMYIYTRGVDRTSYINNDNTPKINYIMESVAFAGADRLWSGMQDKLSAYVNNKGGSSIPITPIKYRPNYEAIKKYLKGQIPLSSVGCN